MFDKFSINKYKSYKYSAPGSIKELKEVMKVNAVPLDNNYANRYDNIYGVFERILEKRNVEFPSELVYSLIKESASIIKKIKDYHNRLRPHQAALNLGISIKYNNMESAKTPSFPSGHAAQSQLIAQVLSDKYPRYTSEFMQEAKHIGNSRLVAHVHYQSDIDVGIKLGNDLYKHYLNNA